MTEHDQELHARRASSFGAQAAAYADHRPDYPREVVRWVLEPLADRDGLRVLDLAAGTGKLTGTLVALGLPVTAVEPDPMMLAELRRQLPEVESLPGTAEAIPLPDDSVDAVFVGQALHWFDTDRAFPEIARILRPGGVLGALWNADDHAVEWVAGLARASRREVDIVRRAEHHSEPGHPPFGPARRELFDHVHRRTADSLTATIATQSHVAVLPEQDRAALLADVRAYLAGRPETAEGEFDLPLVTIGVRWQLPPN